MSRVPNAPPQIQGIDVGEKLMPCGGIYPISKKSFKGKLPRCWEARHPGHNEIIGFDAEWSFVEEWDTYIHDICIDEFLKGPEGEIIISHGHDIIRRNKECPPPQPKKPPVEYFQEGGTKKPPVPPSVPEPKNELRKEGET